MYELGHATDKELFAELARRAGINASMDEKTQWTTVDDEEYNMCKPGFEPGAVLVVSIAPVPTGTHVPARDMVRTHIAGNPFFIYDLLPALYESLTRTLAVQIRKMERDNP